MKAVFKNTNFTLLFLGSFVSNIGTTFYNFAVGWFILSLTNSPLQAGLYIALGAIIQVVATPLAGVYADRINKIRILYITDFIRGISVLVGGLLIFTFSQDLYLLLILYAITVILALNNAFFNPAITALRPEIVDDEQLNQANAVFSFIGSMQTILGVLLAGILYTLLGIELIFIINGISFIVSGFTEMFIRTRHPNVQLRDDDSTLLDDFKVGMRYIKHKTGLLQLMLCAVILNFASAPIFANALPYLYNIVLEKEPIHLSISNITFSSGMLLVGIIIGAMGSNIVIRRNVRQGLTMMTIGFILVGILMVSVSVNQITYTTFTIIFLPLLFVFAISNIWLNVPFMTGMMRAVDSSVRGRVLSMMETLAGALIPLSYVAGGLILEYSNLGILFIFSISLMLIPYTIMMFGKRTNHLLASLS
jgi:MFS family permease